MDDDARVRDVRQITLPFCVMVTGFRETVNRFTEVAQGSTPLDAAIPLFEALNWAVTLDERVKKDWVPDGRDKQPGWAWPVRLSSEADAQAVRGVRFIRNRIHHQWADALRLAKAGSYYPPRELEWVWVAAADLPEADPGHDRGREGYELLLEGRSVEYTLIILIETYEFMAQLLEPRGPPRQWIAEEPQELPPRQREDGTQAVPSAGDDDDGIHCVRAPSVIPYEPRGELLEARGSLREALASLVAQPGQLLHAVVEGQAAFGTDLDNALLYNIGGPQAAPTRYGVLLERLGAGNPPGVTYSYALASADMPGGRRGSLVVTLDRVQLRGRPRSWQEIWAAIRTSAALEIVGTAPVGELGISLVVGAPAFTGSASGEFVKMIVDGVLTALHGHRDTSTVGEVAGRMTEKTGMAATEVAASLLDRESAPLGVCERLVVPWGSGVQCMPEDQRVGLIRIELDRTQKNWSLAGSITLLDPA